MSGHAYFRPPSNTFAGRNNSNNQLFQTYPPQALVWHPMVLNPFNLGNANVFYNAATPAPQYCLRPVYTRTFSPIQSSNNLHLNLHSFNDPLLSSINLNPNLFSNLRSRFGMNTTTDDIVTLQSESCEETTKFGEKRKHDDDNDLKDRKKVKQETKALKAKRPGFTEERYNETSYYVENSLRKVYPYYFTFTTFCKGRWVGQPILEIFAKEFRAHPPEEYERSIKSGAITVNYKKVDITYKLQHNDLLANTVHRHEVPVANFPIEILHECDDLVVVDKPPSIPVHPCGRYRHNTVVFILAKEFNLKNLRTIHRLDRLTSGILLFGRSLKKARQLEHEIRSRLVKKEYVCRVVGEFPTELICCEEPIEVVSYKIGVCRVGPNGKQCKTHFQRLSYNGETSVVSCKPLTGRMHQIRVHLQYLGYPIVNDPLYNHSVFGPERGKGGRIGKTNEELTAELIRIHNAENWLGVDGEEGNEFILPKQETAEIIPKDLNEIPPVKDDDIPNNSDNEDKKLEVAVAPSSCDNSDKVSTPISDSVKIVKDVNCSECKVKYRDPKPEDLVMYLHAWRYQGPDWKFETKLPDWANEN